MGEMFSQIILRPGFGALDSSQHHFAKLPNNTKQSGSIKADLFKTCQVLSTHLIEEAGHGTGPCPASCLHSSPPATTIFYIPVAQGILHFKMQKYQ